MTIKSFTCARTRRAGMVWVFLLLVLSPLFGRDKTDVIVFKNGDRLTCEIKGLARGQLSIKTDITMGTILVDWEKIERIETAYEFQLETDDGTRLAGTLKTDPTVPSSQLIVSSEVGSAQIAQEEVVLMRPLGGSFLRRLDGSVAYNLAFYRDNKQLTSSLDTSVKYDTEGYALQALANSQFSDQSDGTSSNRGSVDLLYKKYLRRRRWFGVGFLDLLKSNQQNLDLRTTLGAGLGRYWIKTNRTILGASSGLVATKERFTADSEPGPSQNNVEAFVALEFSTFRFDSTEFTTTFVMYPSLSRAGRVRASLDSKVKLDLVGDLYWNLSFYENFDSSPPSDTPRNDFGVTMGVGWSF